MSIKRRGFGSMDPKRRREIASKGGRTAHERGTLHRFTPETASLAGKKSRKNRKRREMRGEEE